MGHDQAGAGPESAPNRLPDAWHKWDDNLGAYAVPVNEDGVQFPIATDVDVISIMASCTLADRSVNLIYAPIGPYRGNTIRLFEAKNAQDRIQAQSLYCPAGGCDFSLRVLQGATETIYMFPASASEDDDPSDGSALSTAAINIAASSGAIDSVELLLTPNLSAEGFPADPEVLARWPDLTAHAPTPQPTAAVGQHDATKCLENNGRGLLQDLDCRDCSLPPRQGCADGYIMTSNFLGTDGQGLQCTDITCARPNESAGSSSSDPASLGPGSGPHAQRHGRSEMDADASAEFGSHG